MLAWKLEVTKERCLVSIRYLIEQYLTMVLKSIMKFGVVNLPGHVLFESSYNVKTKGLMT